MQSAVSFKPVPLQHIYYNICVFSYYPCVINIATSIVKKEKYVILLKVLDCLSTCFLISPACGTSTLLSGFDRVSSCFSTCNYTNYVATLVTSDCELQQVLQMVKHWNSSEALVYALNFEAAKSASCYINGFVPSHCSQKILSLIHI